MALSGLVTPLLALLMLAAAVTLDLTTLHPVLTRGPVCGRWRPGWYTALVYGPMSLAAYAFGRAAFDAAPFGLGFALVGTLPTDVSSPHRRRQRRPALRARRRQHRVSARPGPRAVPVLHRRRARRPGAGPEGELAATVILPTIVGVAIRSRWPTRIEPAEPALSATASTARLLPVLAAVGPNTDEILVQPGLIAAFVVLTSGLPLGVALPSVVLAVVPMVTSPLAPKTGGRHTGAPSPQP